ncbi:hypothetical protein SDC9_69947 [bioreactor metagenome]|uniref:Uncharacterized protein n=1 Tax=bioreactor metagenome TaxID=1076179 RepID=A0A644YA73_9ZZZZ|nr:hypothetical protein [Christensenella sp.]
MEQYQHAYSAIHASADFKHRMVDLMLEHNTPRQPRQERRLVIPAKRKALMIVMAAVLLLLSACAAYAIYWSSTQRAIENATENIEKPAAVVSKEAEAYADIDVKAYSLTAPLTGSATIGDATIQLNSMEVFQDVDGAEYIIRYSALSDKIGFITSFAPTWLEDDRAAQERLTQFDSFCEIGIDAKNFVLTIDGQAFPVYSKPDFEGVPEPASGWNEPGNDTPGTSSLMIRQNPVPITQNSQMNLTGTLYSCDATGQRTGTIGTFSIDFAYEYPAAQAEAIRQKAIERYTQSQANTNAARLENLGNLPTELTPVGLTQDAITIDDVTILDDALLLGYTEDRGWKPADNPSYDYTKPQRELYYLNGYQIEPEVMDMSWSEEKIPEPNADGEYTSRISSSILKIPYYRSAQEMPQEIVVYLTRERYHYDGDTHALVEYKSCYPIDLIFRVNRTTGKVTLPKDDTEKENWIAEQTALIGDGRNNARDYVIHQEKTIGGMTVLLERLIYYPASRTYILYAFIPVIDCEVMPWEIDPVVTLNGETLVAPLNDTYYRSLDPTVYPPFKTNIEEWVDTYGLDANRFAWYQYFYRAPKSMLDMPDSFPLDFSWEVYDLGADATRKFIGTFTYTATIQKDVFQGCDARNMVDDMEWKRPIMDAYGIIN